MKFRVKVNNGGWTEYNENLPYNLPAVLDTDIVTVEPIGSQTINYGMPTLVGSIQDVIYTTNTGTQTVSIANAFTGGNLTYSIQAAPAGVTINSQTGVISISTATSEEYKLQTITARATNDRGHADVSFLATLLNIYNAPFQSVNANGWSSTYASPPTFAPYSNPKYVTVNRQGYNVTGQATTYNENLVCTQRIRLPYPDQATLTTDQVALSDYIYTGDTLYGGVAVNNSTETSPKPIANWITTDREVVGNTLFAEVCAFHRNARGREQVACIIFSATDGANTVTQTVSQSNISPLSTDQYKVIVYTCNMDITSLNNQSTITLNATVYPWAGTSASVLSSSAQSAPREFSPRVYRKDTTLYSSPVVAYVAVSGGSDTTGVVSSNPVTAKATPCATIGGAINRLIAVNGRVDGCEIRLMAGTHAINTSVYATTRTQDYAILTITRDPVLAKSAVTMTFGVATVRPRLGAAGGWLKIKGIQVQRTGTFVPQGEAASALRVMFEDLAFDNNSVNSTIFGATCDGTCNGITFSNLGASTLGAGSRELRMLRGCRVTTSVEGWLVIGSYIQGMSGTLAYGTRSASGSIVAYNWFNGASNTGGGFINIAATSDVTGAAVVQNVFEYTDAVSTSSIRFSGDGATGGTDHIIMCHNVIAGTFNNGRSNVFYNEGTVARTNKKMSFKGNIHTQLNTKHDVFKADGTRIQGWGYLYGTGCEGEFSQFIDATVGGIGSSFAQAFPGFNGSLGTSQTVRQDPLFTRFAGTDGTNAGAGNGDYHIAINSPAKARVINSVLRYDLEGNERPATYSSAGPYE